MGRRAILSVIGAVTLAACSDDSPTTANAAGGSGGRSSAVGGSSSGGASPAKGGSGGDGGAKGGATALEPACQVGANPSSSVQKPELIATLFDRWHEAWLASPAVVDLDADGVSEIIVPRDELLLIWHLDGSLVRRFELPGRIWASPVVADLDPSRPGLELAVASRQQIAAWDAQGNPLSGFPFTWRDEMRSLAAADIDGDGGLELVAVTTSDLESGGQTDILIAVHANGKVVNGFPPNTTGHSGCDDACYVHAGYDQNVALGDVDGDGIADILAPQDNSYVSLHHGDGRAFDAAPIFKGRQKFLGIRFMLDYADAQQGYAEDEENSNQAHFTNTAPAIVDVDRDGKNDLVMLGSVQNAAQSDRERGVVLFVVHQDGTRPAEWVKPFHAPEFLDGLWDAGDNIVAATNQVTVLELDPAHAGYEFVFAGFDGKIHAVTSSNEELWQYPFTTRAGVLTGGVIAADLSRDGRPEIVFNSYSTAADQGALFVLSSAGALLHRIPLPGRGAMPVPTAADIDGDGQLEIIVSLKDAVDKQSQVQVYAVPGSGTNCMPWPTGRRDLRRSGLVQ